MLHTLFLLMGDTARRDCSRVGRVGVTCLPGSGLVWRSSDDGCQPASEARTRNAHLLKQALNFALIKDIGNTPQFESYLLGLSQVALTPLS